VVRRVGLMSLPLFGTARLALALLPASGCSDEPAAAVSEADQLFSKEELAEMRKSVKNVDEFRELLKIKTAERAGSNVVKTKAAAGKTEPR